jgi:4-diphosphocytidyl-2-C-methyl-D-erythritol kinase
MATRVRSYSKINLGLGIGPVRGDGFHGLLTLYQTLAMHDVVTVRARRAVSDAETKIELTTNHPFVPRDGRNTAWKMVERCLARLGIHAEVAIHIEKSLPVQGGMGAGSANAAAALIGLEKELGVMLPQAERLALAAEVGSDVPLFLVGGAVLGTGRGEVVEPVRDLPRTVCLVVAPGVGVSTPAAFRAWDAKKQLLVVSSQLSVGGQEQLPVPSDEAHGVTSGTVGMAGPGVEEAGAVTGVGLRQPTESVEVAWMVDGGGLTLELLPDTLKRLSHAYASVFGVPGVKNPGADRDRQLEPGTSGIVPGHEPAGAGLDPEKKQGGSDRSRMGLENDLAENTLLSLVRTGVENDFEEVVFPEYPTLREIKRLLMGIETERPALYAALSGSGSALFGLYRSVADAEAAQQRVQAHGFEFGVNTFVTETLPRPEYWARMFAG